MWYNINVAGTGNPPSGESMKSVETEISLTPKYAIAWHIYPDGSRSIAGILEDYDSVLRLPKNKSVEGKFGKDIRWTAYESAIITNDGRF